MQTIETKSSDFTPHPYGKKSDLFSRIKAEPFDPAKVSLTLSPKGARS